MLNDFLCKIRTYGNPIFTATVYKTAFTFFSLATPFFVDKLQASLRNDNKSLSINKFVQVIAIIYLLSQHFKNCISFLNQ